MAATIQGWEIVCSSPIGSELLARHRPHRRQHSLVADAAGAQLPLDHPGAEVGGLRHRRQ
jgi:hypothetical protein